MTLSLNYQTILWPIQHSGHLVWWPLGIGESCHLVLCVGISEELSGPSLKHKEQNKLVIEYLSREGQGFPLRVKAGASAPGDDC